MDKLKILVLNWRDPLHADSGGAEVHLDRILTYLAQKHQIVLVTTRSKKAKKYYYHGYEVHAIGHPFLFNFTFQYLWYKFYQKDNFDVIIDDISKIGLQTPRYIKDIPIIGIFHHIHGHTLYQLLPYPIALYVVTIEKIALKAYIKTPMIVVSESSKKELLQLADFENITILPNGIDDQYLTFKKPKKNLNQLCSIGRLTYAKRVDLSLYAFQKILQKFPEARFLIIGKGTDYERLQRITKELQIQDSVEFLGFISEDQKIQILRKSIGMLFTSEKEGWGITAIESSASFTPVFGFKVPGLIDSIKENKNGYLVEFGNIDALANKIIEYLELPDVQEQIQTSAYYFAKQFNWQRIAKEFEMIIYNIIVM